MERVYSTPFEILNACSVNDTINYTKRIKHFYSKGGDICSKDKDAACSITRTVNGWIWNCFRCGEFGFVPLENLSPKDSLVILKEKLFNEKVKSYDKVCLPEDYIRINIVSIEEIPREARDWLRSNEIGVVTCIDNDIGWSSFYKRIIFPIYSYENNSTKELIGWLGRDIYNLTKEQRKKEKIPKYILKRDSNVKHPIYKIKGTVRYPASYKNLVVIVEDILSAIKINKVIDCTTIALLNTFIPPNLILDNLTKKYIIWLDKGQELNMINYVNKFSSYGARVKTIMTDLDPKKYNNEKINKYIARTIRRFFRREDNVYYVD